MDYYYNQIKSEQIMNGNLSILTMSEPKEYWDDYTKRQERFRRSQDYNFINYMVYIFYVPLYLAGPISSFNAFISYIKKRQENYDLKQLMKQSLKVLLYFIFLEILLHYAYFCGFDNSQMWKSEWDEYWINRDMKPMQTYEIAANGMLVLTFMYMKFLIIWRFFRLWALFDGIDPPENMNRCMYNNYTFAGFWRSWHRSMNLWLVRYVYKPLGGKKYRKYIALPIFWFVAIWHDLMWRWVVWATLNCIFLVIEDYIIEVCIFFF